MGLVAALTNSCAYHSSASVLSSWTNRLIVGSKTLDNKQTQQSVRGAGGRDGVRETIRKSHFEAVIDCDLGQQLIARTGEPVCSFSLLWDCLTRCTTAAVDSSSKQQPYWVQRIPLNANWYYKATKRVLDTDFRVHFVDWMVTKPKIYFPGTYALY